MSNLIIQPAGWYDRNASIESLVAVKNYLTTIENTVPYEKMEDCLDENVKNRILEIYDKEPIRVWGIRRGDTDRIVNKYDSIRTGDVVLFLQDSFVKSMANISHKTNNSNLAEILWEDDRYKFIYFIKSFTVLDNFSKSELKELMKYKSRDLVRDLRVIEDDRKYNVFRKLNLM